MKNRIQKKSMQQSVLVQTGSQLLSVKPKEEYSPLRVYSDNELEFLTRSDPSFWATDAADYADSFFVRNMCELYMDTVMLSGEPITQIKHFKIANLVLALKKLEVEHPENYKDLCKFYGIDPKRSKSRKCLHKSIASNLLHLCSWGYIELFFPNIQMYIEKVAKKMYCSHEISDLEKAKYAHAFFLFIYTFNFMPYDFNIYHDELKKYAENISATKKNQIFTETLTINHETEKGRVYEAIMLTNIYEALFKTFPENSINIEMIKYFFDKIISKKDSLLIKEFLNLLSDDEKVLFKSERLEPLKYNEDIRIVKERIFPIGSWSTDIKLFVHANDLKFEKAIENAWKKYSQNNFIFGQNVEPYKKPSSFKHVSSQAEYVKIGYLYATTPMRIRISDKNEIKMILAHQMYK